MMHPPDAADIVVMRVDAASRAREVAGRARETLRALGVADAALLEACCVAVEAMGGRDGDARMMTDADAGARARAHPLLVPVAVSASDAHAFVGVCVDGGVGGGEGGRFGGFFGARGGGSGGAGGAVARSGRRGMTHLASSCELYVRRAMAELEREDGGLGASAEAAEALSRLGVGAYEAGELARSGLSSRFEVFVTKKIGRFMDADEALIAAHVKRGDETSALVTAEWHASGPYLGWARPYATNAATLMRYGRSIEARDQARVALSAGPWWTIGESGELMSRMQTLSGYAGRSAEDARRTLDGADVDASGAPVEEGGKPPTKEELAVKRATAAMEAVAWGDRADLGWADVRETVAEAYDEAGLRALSDYVLAPLRAVKRRQTY